MDKQQYITLLAVLLLAAMTVISIYDIDIIVIAANSFLVCSGCMVSIRNDCPSKTNSTTKY